MARPHLWLIRLIGILVPAVLRDDWRREWEAELAHRERLLRRWDRLDWRSQGRLLYQTGAAFWDAVWLQPRRWEDEAIQDIRYSIRALWRAKTFALAAVLSLAIGVGANTAMFTVVNAVVLRPLPYPHADRLVFLGTSVSNVFAVPSYVDLRHASHGLEGLGAYETADLVVSGHDKPVQVQGQRISPEVVTLLGLDDGLRPLLGRMFAPEEFLPSAPRVLLISDRFWQRHFNRAPQAIGQSVLVDGQAHTVLGVTPARFTLFPDSDLLLPLVFTPAQLGDRAYRRLELLGRMSAGVDPAVTRQVLTAAMRGLEPGGSPPIDARLRPLRDVVVAHVDRTLLTLWAVAGLVLLIACVNFANLLLARSVNRQRELAVRAALGARPLRLIRLLLSESAALALMSALVGGWFAFGVVRAIALLDARVVPRLPEIEFDGGAIAFAVILAGVTAVVFGSLPAWQASRPRLTTCASDLAAPGTGFALWRHHRGKSALAIIQIAAALVLLIGAALLAKSHWMLERVSPGYEPARLLAIQFDLPGATYPSAAAIVGFADRLTTRLEHLPGIRYVSAASSLPLLPSRLSFRYLQLEDGAAGNATTADDLPIGFKPPPPPPAPPGRAAPPTVLAYQSVVGPAFFDAMAIPLRQGRVFTRRDDTRAIRVAIVNETMAKRAWPNQSPLDKRFRLRPVDGWMTVIGVSGDIRRFARDDQARPEFYTPLLQGGGQLVFDRPLSEQMRIVSQLSLAVRTSGAPEALIEQVRRELDAIDPTLAMARVSSMQGVIDDAVASRRFVLVAFVVFAGVALLLVGFGTYGVMSYLVERRTQEFGVRLALGASRRQVVWLAVSQGLALGAGGVVLGLAAAAGLSRALRTMLYRVDAMDGLTYATLGTALLLVVLTASYVPSRRALRADPMSALRRD